MEIVQRILNKVVGQDMSVEEQEQVAGGQKDQCEGNNTWSGGLPYSGTWQGCDD